MAHGVKVVCHEGDDYLQVFLLQLYEMIRCEIVFLSRPKIQEAKDTGTEDTHWSLVSAKSKTEKPLRKKEHTLRDGIKAVRGGATCEGEGGQARWLEARTPAIFLSVSARSRSRQGHFSSKQGWRERKKMEKFLFKATFKIQFRLEMKIISLSVKNIHLIEYNCFLALISFPESTCFLRGAKASYRIANSGKTDYPPPPFERTRVSLRGLWQTFYPTVMKKNFHQSFLFGLELGFALLRGKEIFFSRKKLKTWSSDFFSTNHFKQKIHRPGFLRSEQTKHNIP